MHFELTDVLFPIQKECFVLGTFLGEPLHLQKSEDATYKLANVFQSKLEDASDMLWQTEINGHRFLIISCGKRELFTKEIFRKKLSSASALLKSHRIQSAVIAFPNVASKTADWQAQTMVEIIKANYSEPGLFKTDKKEPPLKTVSLFVPGAKEKALRDGEAVADGVILAKDLANLPGNHCTPRILAEKALALSKEIPKLQVEIFDEKQMASLGMGALLAVAQGSVEPPRLIQITWKGAPDSSAPIVLVGKGITFDSGGLSLKTPAGMEEMKFDMAGAASVLGAMKALARLELPINVIGLLACSENMPGPSAVKPGDIVKSLSGQTIEIVNTDAEGRLVLADALTFAERFHPRMVIDIATLTGAVVVALGNHHTGLMTPHDDLAELILKASSESGDTCWRLPVEEAYQEALSSQFADMLNAQFDRTAGSVVAACFLSRFTKKYPWAHLDVAGTAWISGKKREATGRPVSLLLEVLRNVATQS